MKKNYDHEKEVFTITRVEMEEYLSLVYTLNMIEKHELMDIGLLEDVYEESYDKACTDVIEAINQ